MLTGGFARTERCHSAGNLQRRQCRFPGPGHECAGTRQVPPVIRCSIEQKGSVESVHTFTSDCPPSLTPNWPGLRMFPPLPSVTKTWNPVRVPPRARHTPSSEGGFLL